LIIFWWGKRDGQKEYCIIRKVLLFLLLI